MSESVFIDLCDQLTGNIWLQCVLVALAVCFLEDAARCAVGLLVSTARLNWWVAFSGMMAGSLGGDLVLYLIGRYAMAFCLERGWIDIRRIENMKKYFSRHAVKVVTGARFFPGARSVAYVSAGAIHYSFLRFLSVLILTTVLQNLLYLYATDLLGEHFLEYFNDPRRRWTVALLLLTAFVIGHFAVFRRVKNPVEKELDPPL
ncbi:MAG: VTT domain-containing protein [Kiritimatiellia bacterium]